MGTSFINEVVYTSLTAKEVFDTLYDRDLVEYGNDAYSGTFATTYFVGELKCAPEYIGDVNDKIETKMFGHLMKGETTAVPLLSVDGKKRKTVTKKIVVKNGEDFDTVARNAVKLKENERVLSIRVLTETETSTVTAVAVKEKVVTKYFIVGKTLKNTLDDWEKGFLTQAAARARAVEFMEAQDTQNRWRTMHNNLEVVGVSRRESGAGLVELTRTVKKTDYEIEIIVDTIIPGKRGGWFMYGLGVA